MTQSTCTLQWQDPPAHFSLQCPACLQPSCLSQKKCISMHWTPSGNQGWERQLLALRMVGYVTTGTSYFSASLLGKAERHLLKTDLYEVCSQSHSLRTDVNLLRLVEDKYSLFTLVEDKCEICSHLLRTDMKFAHTCQGQMHSLFTLCLIEDRREVCSDLSRTDV